MKSASVVAAGIAVLFLFSVTRAEESKYDVLDKEKVYYGDCTSFSCPATVAIGEIFPHIRSYKLIKERKLNENDPEYWVLILRANETFRNALKLVASNNRLDLIAERGALKKIDEKALLPDVTNLVVVEVTRNPEGKSDE